MYYESQIKHSFPSFSLNCPIAHQTHVPDFKPWALPKESINFPRRPEALIHLQSPELTASVDLGLCEEILQRRRSSGDHVSPPPCIKHQITSFLFLLAHFIPRIRGEAASLFLPLSLIYLHPRLILWRKNAPLIRLFVIQASIMHKLVNLAVQRGMTWNPVERPVWRYIAGRDNGELNACLSDCPVSPPTPHVTSPHNRIIIKHLW